MNVTGYPLTDLALASRLERTEAIANAAFVEARARLDPDVGAAWMDVAGVYAMFDGPLSPLTQTFGLGVSGPIEEADFVRLERFFRDRGAPTCHEVSPLIPPDVVALLNRRGYEPIEFSSVLVRPTAVDLDTGADAVSVRPVDPSEIDLWSRVAASGWSSESAELAAFVEDLSRVVGHARGTHGFLAYREGRPIAAASLILNTDVALLAGASTIPDSRRQGAQLALLEARLRFAASQGHPLAMVVAQPGSGSQRNAERHGFRVVYSRTKWRLRE